MADWDRKLGPDHMIDLSLLGSGLGHRTHRDPPIAMPANGLPNTFVPGRNLLFLTCAATVAYRRGLSALVAGMCETDFSGYPDCRDDTMKAMQVALNLGMAAPLRVETPLMWIDKADDLGSWRDQLGGQALVDLIRSDTHTCYLGDRAQRARLGLRLRHLSGLRAARPRLGALARRRRVGLYRAIHRQETAS